MIEAVEDNILNCAGSLLFEWLFFIIRLNDITILLAELHHIPWLKYMWKMALLLLQIFLGEARDAAYQHSHNFSLISKQGFSKFSNVSDALAFFSLMRTQK